MWRTIYGNELHDRGGSSTEHKKIKAFIKREETKATNLIKIITEMSIEYLKMQIDHGVDYVKIFESWAGLLEANEYKKFIIEPNKEISESIRKYSKKRK